MAKNEVLKRGEFLETTVPAGTVAGDPVMLGGAAGNCPAVAQTDRNTTTGKASVMTVGVHNLSVRGINGATNTAIAEGDILYYDNARTPKLDVTPGGKRYGYALAAVASGATAVIPVKVGY